MTLQEVVAAIRPADPAARKQAEIQWSNVGKPLGSLGLLEDMVVRMAGMFGTADFSIANKAVVPFCADNGVVAEGVTQSGQEVTAVVAGNMARRTSSVCRMAQVAGAQVYPVDIGMALAMGEMGIGNTTTSAAVLTVLLGSTPREMTGRGAGLSDEGLKRKVKAIETALALHQPDPEDAIDILSKVGGFDLAGLCGLTLGGALCRIPVLLDGLISCAAALLAVKLCPAAGDYLLASHLSAEPAGWPVLNALGVKPLVQAGMRLGEGTGAVAVMPMLDMAMVVYHGDTFDDLQIEAYTPQSEDF